MCLDPLKDPFLGDQKGDSHTILESVTCSITFFILRVPSGFQSEQVVVSRSTRGPLVGDRKGDRHTMLVSVTFSVTFF